MEFELDVHDARVVASVNAYTYVLGLGGRVWIGLSILSCFLPFKFAPVRSRSAICSMETKPQGLGAMEFFVIGLAVGGFVVAFFPQLGSPSHNVYSLELTGIDGLGDPAGLSALAFNVTLHARNLCLLVGENRFSHGQVIVSYAGVTLGEGRVPGFSAGVRSTAVARGGRAGMVRMPGGLLRRRVEAELRWDSAEFDVEAKLFRDGLESGPVVLWCKVGSQVPQQPSLCQAFTDFQAFAGSPF